MRHFWGLLATTFNEWLEDKAPRLGAAVAYYAAFSIAPLFVLFMSVMGFFYKGDALSTVRYQVAEMAGDNAGDAVVAVLRGVQQTGGSKTATVLSLITLLIAATGMFGQLQDAMNTIWEVAPKPRRFWWDTLRTRFLSFLMIVAFSAVLLLSLALTTVLANVTRYFQTMLPATASLWPLADLAVSFIVTTVLFAAIFKILPDVSIAWSDVWVGAAATAVLFAAGKIGIGLYLGRSSFTSAYGAAGSLLALLAWVYFSAQILFFGAELTFVYAREYKHRFRPARGAAFLSEDMRIKQGIPHTETVEDAFKKKTA